MNEFSSRKNTILFVDDEDVILDIAGEYFQGKGYQVLTARNGREALEAMKAHSTPIDCCFTDINMPEMDGLALAECIRKWDNTIPVVIMTGYPSVDNTLRTLKNGVVDFLIKPINLEQMFLCLQRVLRERELFVHKLLLKKEVEGKKRLEQLNKELLERIEELNVLNRIMSDLMSLRTGSEVFDHMVQTAVSLTRAGGGLLYAAGTSVAEPFLLSAAEPETKGCPSAEAMAGGAGKSLTDACLFPKTLIAEIAADEIPLLSSGNGKLAGLPDDICSFVAVPIKIRDMVFGVLVVFSTTKARCFAETDLYYLSFMVHHAAYQVENLALYENIYENLLSTLSAFVSTVEARDAYTRAHSHRVTQMAVIMAEKWGCAKEDIDVIDFAGRLHDIGKIGIRDDILLKPGPLTPAEYEVIKQHPVIGESIVSQLGIWRREQKIIRHHHEWYDGTGYPDGLKAEQTPLLARILAVTDAYDAMITRRPYRDVMDAADALAVIRGAAGSQFDPAFVDLFLKLHGQGAFDEI